MMLLENAPKLNTGSSNGPKQSNQVNKWQMIEVLIIYFSLISHNAAVLS